MKKGGMKVAYIAGPFTGETAWDIECNVRRAEELALEVAKMGVMPLCPHTNTRFFHGQIHEAFWYEGTAELLRRCDIMITVPGWEKSNGARAEVGLANELEIPIIHSSDGAWKADLLKFLQFGRMVYGADRVNDD
jgi:hypothetical protein